MSSSTTEFHKIWIDQCAATEDIRDNFGPHSALDYLIGEKLFSFLRAAEQDPLFARRGAGLYQGDPAAFCSRSDPRLS
jgi:hypothetical protein